jgi:hypothetical protein
MQTTQKNKFIVLQSDTPDFDAGFELGEYSNRKQAKKKMMEQAHVDLTSGIYQYYCVVEYKMLDIFPNVSQDKPKKKIKIKIETP